MPEKGLVVRSSAYYFSPNSIMVSFKNSPSSSRDKSSDCTAICFDLPMTLKGYVKSLDNEYIVINKHETWNWTTGAQMIKTTVHFVGFKATCLGGRRISNWGRSRRRGRRRWGGDREATGQIKRKRSEHLLTDICVVDIVVKKKQFKLTSFLLMSFYPIRPKIYGERK